MDIVEATHFQLLATEGKMSNHGVSPFVKGIHLVGPLHTTAASGRHEAVA